VAYATPVELDALALPPDVASRVADADKASALEAASALADSYLAAAGYAVPLPSWGDDLKAAVCAIAAFDLAVSAGLAPEDGEGSNLYLKKRDAVRWLERVARGEAKLSGASSTTSAWGAPRVRSADPRGW